MFVIQGQCFRAYHPRCSKLRTRASSVASKMIECHEHDLTVHRSTQDHWMLRIKSDRVLLHSNQNHTKCLRAQDNLFLGSIQIFKEIAIISFVLVFVFVLVIAVVIVVIALVFFVISFLFCSSGCGCCCCCCCCCCWCCCCCCCYCYCYCCWSCGYCFWSCSRGCDSCSCSGSCLLRTRTYSVSSNTFEG